MKFERTIKRLIKESPDETVDVEGNEYTWNGAYNYEKTAPSSSSDLNDYSDYFEPNDENICFIIYEDGSYDEGQGMTHAMLRRYKDDETKKLREVISGRYFTDPEIISFWDSESEILKYMDYIKEFVKVSLKKDVEKIWWDIEDNLHSWEDLQELIAWRKEDEREYLEYEQEQEELRKLKEEEEKEKMRIMELIKARHISTDPKEKVAINKELEELGVNLRQAPTKNPFADYYSKNDSPYKESKSFNSIYNEILG
jgi:hypothetical protein